MSLRRIALVRFLSASILSLAAAALPTQNPFATPSKPEHALLKKLVGKWDATFELKMPGAPPIKSHGKEVNEMLGELWIVGRYDDPGMMGGAFAGAQLVGYDPDEKKYVAAWADNQTANLSVQKGVYDESKKTLTLLGKGKDPMSGAESTVRTVWTFDGDDRRTQSLFVGGADGKEMEMFAITYQRAK
jgi:hypothetical protein